VIGVSVDNEVISLENDMMDIHYTTVVMRLIHKWFYITIVMKRDSISLDCEIFLKSLPPEGCFENINRRTVNGRSKRCNHPGYLEGVG